MTHKICLSAAALLALLQNAGVDPQPITEENDGRERMRL